MPATCGNVGMRRMQQTCDRGCPTRRVFSFNNVLTRLLAAGLNVRADLYAVMLLSSYGMLLRPKQTPT